MSIIITPIPRLLSLVAPNFGVGEANVAGSATTAVSSNSTLGFLPTQAEMEAYTSNVKFVTPGTAKFHPGVAKAWVSFDYSGTAPTKMGSYNVSSLGEDGRDTFRLIMTMIYPRLTVQPLLYLKPIL